MKLLLTYIQYIRVIKQPVTECIKKALIHRRTQVESVQMMSLLLILDSKSSMLYSYWGIITCIPKAVVECYIILFSICETFNGKFFMALVKTTKLTHNSVNLSHVDVRNCKCFTTKAWVFYQTQKFSPYFLYGS